MNPSEGERRAVVGFSGQYGLAARVVYPRLRDLEWIHVADPSAGIADDFQFKAGATRHALQVKWSEYPDTFTWSALTAATKEADALLTGLAAAWKSLRASWSGPLRVHLCTNNNLSKSTTASVFKSADAADPRHFAAFVKTSLLPVQAAVRSELLDMAGVQAMPVYTEWLPVWKAFQAVSGLGDDELVGFLQDFEFDTGIPSLEVDADSYGMGSADSQVLEDLRNLAHEIQASVADPSRLGRIGRDELLSRLGWQSRLEYRNRHDFPVPGTYVPNGDATRAIQEALETLSGGYVALVGPAGSGKSTLLSDIKVDGRIVHYFAFVPDSPDPLSHRGEAESFLNDLSIALDDSGVPRTRQPAGLLNLRKCVEDQLAWAAEAWRQRGERTIIVVDGLDHITREQSPSRSMLEELLMPAALGQGVFIILGTQTTHILAQPIRASLAETGRTIQLPPLTREEVAALAERAGLDNWMWPGQIDRFVDSSEGHALAVTYLINELLRIPEQFQGEAAQHAQAERILEDVSRYGGDVELRYRGYLQATSSDVDVLDLLGTIARLRIGLNVAWMKSWAPAKVIDRFVNSTRTFFRVAGDEWHFVHNSFRRFLEDETAKLGGEYSENIDRDLHLKLAARCAASNEIWSIYRDEEIAHLYLAGAYERVLDIVTPQTMRDKLRDLQPFARIKDQTGLALRAAAESGAEKALTQLTLFHAELALREQALDADKLADAIVGLLPPQRAINYVVHDQKIVVALEKAARIAADWSMNGHDDAAASILNSIQGLSGLMHGRLGRSDKFEAVGHWAAATMRLSGLDAVLSQVDRHLMPPPPETSINAAAVSRLRRFGSSQARWDEDDKRVARLFALTQCFDEALRTRDPQQLDEIQEAIDSEGLLDWRARTRLVRGRAAAADGDTEEALACYREMLSLEDLVQTEESTAGGQQPVRRTGEPNPKRIALGLRLAAVLNLLELGAYKVEEFEKFVEPTETATIDREFSPDSKDKYRDVFELATLRKVAEIASLRTVTGSTEVSHTSSRRPTPTTVVAPGSRRNRDPGGVRLDQALYDLSQLYAESLAFRNGLLDEAPVVTGRSSSVIKLMEVPRQNSDDWSGWYRVRAAFPEFLQMLAKIAYLAGGSAEIARLVAAFEAAWEGERARFWPVDLRHAALAAIASTDRTSHAWVRERLADVATLIVLENNEPSTQVDHWLKQSEISRAIAEPQAARAAIRAAVDHSLGLGLVEHNGQLAQWLDWFSSWSEDNRLTVEGVTKECLRFASRLLRAVQLDEHATHEAADEMVALLWPVSPMRATRIGLALCESGTMEEASLIAAVLSAAAVSGAVDNGLLVNIAVQLLLPVAKSAPDELLERLESGAGTESRKVLKYGRARWGLDLDSGVADAAGTAGPPVSSGQSDSGSEVSQSLDTPRQTATGMLTQLRGRRDEDSPSKSWWDEACSGALASPMDSGVAKALIEQMTRLDAPPEAVGLACAALALTGGVVPAIQAMEAKLSRLPGGGWISSYDGGTRYKLVFAALRHRDPSLLRAARNDFVRSVVSGVLTWTYNLPDLKRIAELLAGKRAVAACWPDVDEYLDLLAPSGPEVVLWNLPVRTSQLADEGTPAVIALVSQFLGHPTKEPEEAARRILSNVLLSPASLARSAALAATEDGIRQGGWPAEAALSVLEVAQSTDLPPQLLSEIRSCLTSGDQILRDLAARICRRLGLTADVPARRDLSPIYRMDLPPLPERSAPELDRQGIPFIDPNDPRQIIAPYDELLYDLAETVGVSPEAVLHHAAQVARTPRSDDWTDAGHRAMAARLERRGQKRTYRPWAFMVGRRAAAEVLADLVDAFRDAAPPEPSVWAGLTAPHLLSIQPSPLESDIPLPWRPPDVASYDTRGWCDEVSSAVEHYKDDIDANRKFVLAESSEWEYLDRGHAEERRLVVTKGNAGKLSLSGGESRAVEFVGSAASYPDLPVAWNGDELVVRGLESFSNAPYLYWWAMHPAAAHALGWEADQSALFSWRGPDGQRRAQTVYVARRPLNRKSVMHDYEGEVWRVVLSGRALDEVRRRFGPLSRSLVVNRVSPANRGEESEERRSRAEAVLPG